MNEIPQMQTTALNEWFETRPTLLVTSPRAYKAVQDRIARINVVQRCVIETAEKEAIEALAQNLERAEVIYAIGGGQVVDVARYLASQWNVPVFCVPTVISSDAFLVDCTGLRENGCVTYVPTVVATTILLDWEILMRTDTQYHLTGCGDVLSIYTALYDWKQTNDSGHAAHDELYDIPIATIARSIFDALLTAQNELRKGSRKGIQTVITCLAMEVLLCNFYGNSRPEEGGEHFFAYCVERKVPHFMHGEMVSLGVLLTACIQGQDWKRIQAFLDNIGLSYMPKGLTRAVVIETLQEMPEYVVEHKLRRSIYNEFTYAAQSEMINKFLDKVGLK